MQVLGTSSGLGMQIAQNKHSSWYHLLFMRYSITTSTPSLNSWGWSDHPFISYGALCASAYDGWWQYDTICKYL